MKFKWLFLVSSALIVLGSMSFKLPNGLLKKVEREVRKVMETSKFTLNPVVVDTEVNKLLPAKIDGDNLYKIIANNELLGFAFVDKAPSKTAEFDYLIILSKDRSVKHAKVLIYREEYGGEIGSRRWLKQFYGKTENDRLKYNQNVDVISGATISVRSMTRAIDEFLQTVKILHINNII